MSYFDPVKFQHFRKIGKQHLSILKQVQKVCYTPRSKHTKQNATLDVIRDIMTRRRDALFDTAAVGFLTSKTPLYTVMCCLQGIYNHIYNRIFCLSLLSFISPPARTM